MLTTSPKPKTCACGRDFVPWSTTQVVCSGRCAQRKVAADKAAKKAAEKAMDKARREANKGLRELLAEAQEAFNEFVRLRDRGQNCIDCNKPFEPQKPGGSVDAGHYLARSIAPNLRFCEDNCFAQRKNCNRPGGATRSAFRSGVLDRIGEARLLAVEADRDPQGEHKWTREELIAIRDTYRAKVKEMKGVKS